GDFSRNIFAMRAVIDYDRAIGVTMPRLHGFHRFLPHLWQLFYLADGWLPGRARRAGLSSGPSRGRVASWDAGTFGVQSTVGQMGCCFSKGQTGHCPARSLEACDIMLSLGPLRRAA